MDTDSNPTWRVHVSEAHFREGVRVVEMPCCGFAYDSLHADASPGETYTCPLCETDDEVAALRADLAIAHTACTETERDMAETIAALRAEVERMRPVVVESVWDVENNVPLPSHLRMAIDAYRATQQEVDA